MIIDAIAMLAFIAAFFALLGSQPAAGAFGAGVQKDLKAPPPPPQNTPRPAPRRCSQKPPCWSWCHSRTCERACPCWAANASKPLEK